MNVVALDVDGVLNAVTINPDRTRYTAGRPAGGPVDVDLTVPPVIASWHDTGLAEVQWLTTWEDNALHLAAPLGLPQGLRVHHWRDQIPDPRTWWKLSAVRQLLADGHRVLWLDDDTTAGYDQELDEFLATADPARLHVITPDFQVGLTAEHLAAGARWLADTRETRHG